MAREYKVLYEWIPTGFSRDTMLVEDILTMVLGPTGADRPRSPPRTSPGSTAVRLVNAGVLVGGMDAHHPDNWQSR